MCESTALQKKKEQRSERRNTDQTSYSMTYPT
jgi:hypothetical protein